MLRIHSKGHNSLHSWACVAITETTIRTGHAQLIASTKIMGSYAEMIGIPHVLVVGDRGLDNGVVEYRQRGGESGELAIDEAVASLRERIGK